MATNPNMVAIQTVEVGSGGAASIEFTSIPQTYTDLVLKLSLKSNRTDDNVDVAMLSFNGNTSNGSWRELYGTGSTVGSQSNSSAMRGAYTNVSVTPSQTSVWGNAEIYIPNYTSSNNKSYSGDGVGEANTTNVYAGMHAGLWSNSAAITSVAIAPLVGSLWNQYSTATLYGIKNS